MEGVSNYIRLAQAPRPHPTKDVWFVISLVIFGGKWMSRSGKINRLAMISFVSGGLAYLLIALIFVVYNLLEPENAIVNITDAVLMPLRNGLLVVALVAGILGLVDIKKKAGAEKGKGVAWVGIALSVGWFLFGLLIGLIFLSPR